MRRPGFTLVELLVVLAILVAAFALAGGAFLRKDGRLQAVKAAAEELAAVCRQARALASARNATHGVVFHLQNHPDSSGRVLNNRSGGHWYRIVGPPTSTATHMNRRTLMEPRYVDNLPPVVGGMGGGSLGNYAIAYPFTLAQTAELMRNSWVGEAHVLAPGKVRFLALSDMDYGDYNMTNQAYRMPSATMSYPRPWFGWYDRTGVAGGGAGRLYPWGGYDPAIAGSGFFYAGHPGAAAYAALDAVAPVGSRHGVDRKADRWHDAQIRISSSGNWIYEQPAEPLADVIHAALEPRPVLDAEWRDVSLSFAPTGEVTWGGTMPGRHCPTFRDIVPTGANPRVFRGVADRCNGIFAANDDAGMLAYPHHQGEMGTFEQDAGGFYITLAPDVVTDTDTFPDAKSAIDALMPIFRVFVSTVGEVRVVPISRTRVWAGGLAPFPTSEAWYRTGTNMRTLFPRDRMLDGSVLSGGVGVGAVVGGGPVTDALTGEMLENRAVWLK